MHLTMNVNFLSSKDNYDKPSMDSKSDYIEIMIGNNTNEIINELFSSILSRYQIDLETSMKGSNFVFDHVDRLDQK